MRYRARTRRLALALAGLLLFAGLGAVTHAIDHGGKPADVVCSFCVSGLHGKSPPPARPVEAEAAATFAIPATDIVDPRSSHETPTPPARAPPRSVHA